MTWKLNEIQCMLGKEKPLFLQSANYISMYQGHSNAYLPYDKGMYFLMPYGDYCDHYAERTLKITHSSSPMMCLQTEVKVKLHLSSCGVSLIKSTLD